MKPDFKKAARYATQAAHQEVCDAQWLLGYLYMNGSGVQKDLKKALYWSRKAAEKGHPTAEENVRSLEKGYSWDDDGNLNCRGLKRPAIVTVLLWGLLGLWGAMILFVINMAFMFFFSLDFKVFALSIPLLMCITGLVMISRWNRNGVGWWLMAAALPVLLSDVSWFSNVSPGNGEHTDFFMSGMIFPSLRLTAIIAMILLWFTGSRWRKGGLLRLLLLGVSACLTLLFFEQMSGRLFGSRSTMDSDLMIPLYFIAGLFALLFVHTRSETSIYSALYPDSSLNRWMNELGVGEAFLASSPEFQKYGTYKNISALLIAATVAWITWRIISSGSVDVNPLNSNIFESSLIVPLMIVSFFIGLKFSVPERETRIVGEDRHGNRKDLGRSWDIMDTMDDQIIYPLLARFLLYPLLISAAIYYVLYLLFELLSFVLPFLLMVGLPVAAYYFYRKWIARTIYKSCRKTLFPAHTVLIWLCLISLIYVGLTGFVMK
jgi:hypothetical protein